SVFLDVRDTLRLGIQFRPPKKRTTPRVDRPRPLRILDTPDLKRLDPVLQEFDESERVALLVGAAEALRPALDDRECTILDWLLNPYRCTLTALASELDITKGYASKLQGRILNKIHKKMSATPEESRKLIERGRHTLTERDLKDRAHLIRSGAIPPD